MKIQDVIQILKDAKEPAPKLDGLIAIIAGYRRRGENADSWVDPEGSSINRPPRYTEVIDDAITLQAALCPQLRVGCAWEVGEASANVGSTTALSVNPAMALSIATLEEMLSLQSARNE
ncbi:hypothetical protein ASG25_01960 [Rhizobium sp. Leaf384]|uniref:hypothetical protein n=1 Tax=unclassified Rhizobium TaxID=2613769 RepID=UPI0007147545|nr:MULTISPECIES: hypothetical protein [unclassified Rhizobium]KQS74204.1 hypothetical protein ASG58_17025 [Rhizobium sp. Leaf383]KQS80399.1 hypothetical protein ASG25_01960 [Rhizobium sp. Leaf384]